MTRGSMDMAGLRKCGYASRASVDGQSAASWHGGSEPHERTDTGSIELYAHVELASVELAS